jgi:hypothetical protein
MLSPGYVLVKILKKNKAAWPGQLFHKSKSTKTKDSMKLSQ